MIIEADAKGLEVVASAYLSQCPVLCKELRDGVDIHGENQKDLSLPDGKPGRLAAKRFKFKLIFGGNAYSYANDPEFNWISRDKRYWAKVIDEYYLKYYGMAKWHTELVRNVTRTGIYTSPTGRQFQFYPKNGEWPRTTILNYPVQSLGADIMSLIRISAHKRITRELKEVLFVNTVHDSIVIDSPKVYVNSICNHLRQTFDDFPGNFKKVWGSEFNLPLKCEIMAGPNWKEMKEI